MEILSMGPIDSILKDLHSQNKSIGWMLSFLKTMFCVIDLEFIEFESKKMNFKKLKFF